MLKDSLPDRFLRKVEDMFPVCKSDCVCIKILTNSLCHLLMLDTDLEASYTPFTQKKSGVSISGFFEDYWGLWRCYGWPTSVENPDFNFRFNTSPAIAIYTLLAGRATFVTKKNTVNRKLFRQALHIHSRFCRCHLIF